MWGAAVRWNVADFSAVTVFWDTISQSLSTCFLFNLRCKFTFYDIQFMRYTIVANSAISSLQDIKIPVLHTPTLVARQFLRAYIYAFHIPKVFLFRKLEVNFQVFTPLLSYGEAASVLTTSLIVWWCYLTQWEKKTFSGK